jgi:hypothetical protein
VVREGLHDPVKSQMHAEALIARTALYSKAAEVVSLLPSDPGVSSNGPKTEKENRQGLVGVTSP